jgi:hypothetical protein
MNIANCERMQLIDNHSYSKQYRYSIAYRTSPFQGGNTGSNPVGDANKKPALLFLTLLFPILLSFNYLPLRLCYPVEPVYNLIDLFIRNHNLSLDLFALCGRRK